MLRRGAGPPSPWRLKWLLSERDAWPPVHWRIKGLRPSKNVGCDASGLFDVTELPVQELFCDAWVTELPVQEGLDLEIYLFP